MSASQNASGGPKSVPTWNSRPNASTVATSPGGLRYSTSGRISQSTACSSRTSQTTSRGRARISSTTSEVKRMKRPKLRTSSRNYARPAASDPGCFDKGRQRPRQLASDRDGNFRYGRCVDREEVALSGFRKVLDPRGDHGGEETA